MTKIKSYTDLPPVAITGKMGAGKTTVADYLSVTYDYNQLHFAAALKQTAAAIWGEEKVHHNRDLLQKFGVAVRDIDEDAWVNIVVRKIEEADWYGTFHHVVDDCRFPNEWEALANLDFRFIQVEADENERFSRLQRIHKIDDREQMTHISETAIEQFNPDYTITNNGDRDYLYQQIDKIIEKERRRV